MKDPGIATKSTLLVLGLYKIDRRGFTGLPATLTDMTRHDIAWPDPDLGLDRRPNRARSPSTFIEYIQKLLA